MVFPTVFDNFLPSLALSLSISFGGYLKQSLSLNGAVAAFCCGFISFYSGHHFGIPLIAFFILGSLVTRVSTARKSQLEDNFKLNGQRDFRQVLCNSLSAVIACSIYRIFFGSQPCPLSATHPLQTFLQAFYMCFYASCTGDTFASELGILQSSPPILITTFQAVLPGTNGGVSISGTLASGLGGALIGLVCFGSFSFQTEVISLCFTAGILGSLIDSYLGATLQYSGYCSASQRIVNTPAPIVNTPAPIVNTPAPIVNTPAPTVKHISGKAVLSNNMVNLISGTITAFIGGYFMVLI